MTFIRTREFGNITIQGDDPVFSENFDIFLFIMNVFYGIILIFLPAINYYLPGLLSCCHGSLNFMLEAIMSSLARPSGKILDLRVCEHNLPTVIHGWRAESPNMGQDSEWRKTQILELARTGQTLTDLWTLHNFSHL